MSNWKLIGVVAGGTLGWTLLVIVTFASPDWLSRDLPSPAFHPDHEPATREGPPVIFLRDLGDRGYEEPVLDRIEPHFHVLNAALVTIVELKEAYDTASISARRDRLREEADYFHMTAERHEEQIERLLPPELAEPFHQYIRERESAAGLQNDTIWHRHYRPAHRGA